jgi:hypothetical protein
MAGDPHAGFVSAFVAPFADEATAQSRRPPHAQRQSRAGCGAALLSGCYITLDVCGPLASSPAPPVLLYAWWGCAALGVYWLLAGLLGRARGPLVGGLGLFAEAAGASWLLWSGMYPAAMPFASFLLHGLYLSVLCAALAQILAVLLVLPSRDAERAVRRNMAAKNPPIIPVRRAR